MQKIRLSGTDKKRIAEQIIIDIDAFSVAHFSEGPRNHIGASEMGKQCLRQLVYGFRWMFREDFSGPMMRLFNRGHSEEDRFALWLRGMGAQVATHDHATGKQIRIGGDHYGGSLDGIIELPERYRLPFPMLLEMKTHNDRSFNKLVKSGVKMAKPDHYAQMNQYGTAKNLDYAVYIAVNKNDDKIHVEIVDIDRSLGQALMDKGATVVAAQTLPPRIAASPAYDTCKYCPAVGICHLNKPPLKNCRSCKNAVAIAGGIWHCRLVGRDIPKDKIGMEQTCWQEFGK